MAQTSKKRRRKHRGTQSGSLDRKRSSGGRPRSRKEAESRAKSRQAQKRDQPPTWRGAITRGLVATALFLALVVVVFQRPFGAAIALSVLMLAFYIPMGYFIDRFFWRRRQLKAQQERQAERERRKD